MDGGEVISGLFKIGTPLAGSMAIAIAWLVNRLKVSDRKLRAEMKESNEKCEERNKVLAQDLKDLRDVTLHNNTNALNANTRALDRFVDSYGSGHHKAITTPSTPLSDDPSAAHPAHHRHHL